ncbi:metal-dependent hydrolase [Stetteria hydrogenophila]
MGYLVYYGHSAFELGVDGKKILIDPWLSNPLSPVKPEDVTGVDLVVLTHGHDDHVGDAVTILRRNPGAKLVAIYELANHVAAKARAEDRAVGGNMGGPMHVDGLRIALVPANHSSPIGAPTGVVIQSSEGTVYHAGDTGLMSEMQFIGEIYKPDIALLPIGGHFTMDPVEAAKAVELLKPKVAIPMHYATFPVLYGKPEEFKRLVEERAPGVEVVILKPGERYEFSFKH